MCLSVVKHRFFFPRSKKVSQIGYKWFSSNWHLLNARCDEQIKLSNFIVYQPSTYELDKWYTSTKWQILEGCYFSGFHILNTLEDALHFEDDMSEAYFNDYISIKQKNKCYSKVMAKVEYRNIVASGYQCGSAVVAQKMKILEVL